MVFRIIRQLLNNEKVIQEMSESAPIRTLAKLVVRGAATAEQKVQQLKLGDRIERVTKIYKEEYKKAIEKK